MNYVNDYLIINGIKRTIVLKEFNLSSEFEKERFGFKGNISHRIKIDFYEIDFYEYDYNFNNNDFFIGSIFDFEHKGQIYKNIHLREISQNYNYNNGTTDFSISGLSFDEGFEQNISEEKFIESKKNNDRFKKIMEFD